MPQDQDGTPGPHPPWLAPDVERTLRSLALFLLDRAGVVVGMNAAAERLLAGGRLELGGDGQLTGSSPRAVELLRDLLRGRSPGGAEGWVQLPLAAGGGPLLVHPIPLVATRKGAPVLALRALDLSVVVRSPASLQERFQLTETEASVATLLATGLSPQSVAAVRGVSLQTVRTQIRSIYGKLNVHRQVDLVHRLQSMAARPRPGPRG